jgi:serine/threonine protein kinase
LTPLGAGSTVCDGRYRLDAIVGRGGMAAVWRATDVQLERDVAVKIISDVIAGDPVFVARFEREARLAAALNHPNLVKVFDFSVEDERPFLVMEYVPGGTLAERRNQELDVEALARDLLDAVAHIHDAGILHRDIKPANVLLSPDGSPRLTDFGIARGDDTAALTQTGQVLGTLRYIAPEVAAGEPATAKSDLYGLGVLLSELKGPRSEALGRLLERLKAREAAERPASAGEALAGLDPTRVRERPAPPKPHEQQGGLTPYGGVTNDCADATYARVRGQAPSRWSGFSASRRRAATAAVLLVGVLALVVAAASDDGGKLDVPAAPAIRAASAGAPADRQLDRLEQIVRAARKR